MSNPNGRPCIEIDWKQVDTMCGIQCTGEEIAAVLGIDYDTLVNACKREKGVSFSEYFEQKRDAGKASLRRRMYTAAVTDGNPTMMIWLSKQYLGHKDKQEFSGDPIQPLDITVKLVKP
jgi:methylphosphotriester-DNA--protein-cysteine methyltransferase